ncbi:MAG: cation diffusion facilitator family transporter [Pseudomonadota bacterium]|jgi:cation diffusion facilitator family transporter
MSELNENANAGFGPENSERYRAAQKVTWVSVAANVVLTVLQIVVGFFGKSQALIADGLHSLSDLLADFLVLFANRHGSRSADAEHPYGHGRIETATTLILGAMLVGLGIALLWGAGMRLQAPQAIQTVHPATLWIAILTLAAKEGLFRYMLREAKRLRSQMLIANAWHSRSDAASSLVVALGIAGNLAGFAFLDLVAAVLVAFMIAHMGWKLGFDALQELVDTALDEKEVAAIRATLLETPGVRGLHELRTRKMANQALVDAHVLVDPRISVSEGHHIAERARNRLLERHEVLDVMVHVDPEDDAVAKPNAHLPGRQQLLQHLEQRLGMSLAAAEKITLHYLDGKAEAEIFLPAEFFSDHQRVHALKIGIAEIVRADEYFRSIHLHRLGAP